MMTVTTVGQGHCYKIVSTPSRILIPSHSYLRPLTHTSPSHSYLPSHSPPTYPLTPPPTPPDPFLSLIPGSSTASMSVKVSYYIWRFFPDALAIAIGLLMAPFKATWEWQGIIRLD